MSATHRDPPKPAASSAVPRWVQSLIRRAAPPHRTDEALGDLEEVHRNRVRVHGKALAAVFTSFETLDMCVALLRERADVRRADRRRTVRQNAPTKGSTHTRRTFAFASRLDFKLGLRMVARYPSLTAVAVLAMAFGIGIGATGFELLKVQIFPPLPYSSGNRIVAIQNVSVATTRPDSRALYDFENWRRELRTVERLSVLYLRKRNLAFGQSASQSVTEAQVSAVAFDLLERAPLLGRPLLLTDESAVASPVAVLSYELWQQNFSGARDVIGKVVRLGGQQTTIVGVMPKGFTFFVPSKATTFPAAQDLWVPFRLHATHYTAGEGPGISVFGQLAAGVTPEKARAELATFSARTAAATPTTHQYLKAQLLMFARPFSFSGGFASTAVLSLGTLFIAMLMVVMCGNVALLLFARAATREREIAVRSALGATRGSIVAQLFAEALVLAAIAIVVGLAGASVGLKWAIRSMTSMMQADGLAFPPWIRDGLSPTTALYAVALSVIGAAVAGILPGLKVTGKRGHLGLQRMVGTGGSGVRLGGVWTAIVISQVALTSMLVPIAVVFGVQTFETRRSSHSLPSAEILAVRLEVDSDARTAAPGVVDSVGNAKLVARFEQNYRALSERLAKEPGVTGVTVARQLPGSIHDGRRFQTDALGAIDSTSWERRAQIASVDVNFFETLQTPVAAGRDFIDADAGGNQRVVIVNESFVREHLGGRNAVGHRVRYRDGSGRNGAGVWYTIVGVARDVAMTVDPTVPNNAGIYHVLQSGVQNVEMAVRIAGTPVAFISRLHELAAEVGPALRVQRIIPLNQAGQSLFIAYDATFRVIVLCGVMAILLTNAGIYAVISFTVARRTREIGVRVALGAERKQVIAVVLARAAKHVGIGVLIGVSLGSALAVGVSEGGMNVTILQGGAMIVAYMCSMTVVCLLACVVPTWRALCIEPTVALSAEG